MAFTPRRGYFAFDGPAQSPTHAPSAAFTPRRGYVPIPAVPKEKTSRTLFIEQQHERLVKEAREDAMFDSMMRSATPPRPAAPQQPPKPGLRSTALALTAARALHRDSVLFTERDRRRWESVCERRRPDDRRAAATAARGAADA